MNPHAEEAHGGNDEDDDDDGDDDDGDNDGNDDNDDNGGNGGEDWMDFRVFLDASSLLLTLILSLLLPQSFERTLTDILYTPIPLLFRFLFYYWV